MQTINYNDLTENLPKLIEKINNDHDVICLEMPIEELPKSPFTGKRSWRY